MHWKQVGSATLAVVALVIPWAWPEMPNALHFVVWPIVAWGAFYTLRGWTRDRISAGKMGLEGPQIVIVIGLAIAVLGLGWQVLRGTTKTVAGEPVPSSFTQPRRLSDEQQGLVAGVLRNSDWQPDSVWIRYAEGCDECRRYANDLKAALTLAGWNGDFGTTPDAREELVGLKLHVADLSAKPTTAALLAVALTKASINFEWSPWPELEKDRTILFAYRPKD